MQIITIDGPVASGKSTIARELARSLGFYYLYSGLWYRALAYLWLREHTLEQMHDGAVAQWLAQADLASLQYTIDEHGRDHMALHGKDITSKLHTAAIDEAASRLSGFALVRAWVNSTMHQLAHGRNIVADGRDMGSEVFPHATLKIFLTADLDVRAERWRAKQHKQGMNYTHEQACALIQERDERDAQRTLAPLCVPVDAHIIYNNGNDPQAVVQELHKFFTSDAQLQ
jgi:cytidylate kinase